jgi:endogenous inhibitor of DNA gyrase (YacG/DUF329 family)
MPRCECPVCGKIVKYGRLEDALTLPFCSERCKLIDLGKWLEGEYRIEGEPLPEDEEGDGKGP